MKYQNKSDYRQTLTVAGKKTQLLPGDVIESDRELKFVFLEKVDDSTDVTVKAGSKFSSILNLQQKVSSLESQKDKLRESSNEIQKLTEENAKLKDTIKELSERQDSLEADTTKKLEMMKSAIMMIQEDFYNVDFDESGKAVEKDPTFRKTDGSG